jgi:hypothetical protein
VRTQGAEGAATRQQLRRQPRDPASFQSQATRLIVASWIGPQLMPSQTRDKARLNYWSCALPVTPPSYCSLYAAAFAVQVASYTTWQLVAALCAMNAQTGCADGLLVCINCQYLQLAQARHTVRQLTQSILRRIESHQAAAVTYTHQDTPSQKRTRRFYPARWCALPELRVTDAQSL